MKPILRQVAVQPDQLCLSFEDGTSAELDSLWLYDNRPDLRDALSGQRLRNVADLPEAPRLLTAHLTVDGLLQVQWQEDDAPAYFDPTWLHRSSRSCAAGNRLPDPHSWIREHAPLFPRLPWATFLDSADAQRQWLRGFVTYGVAFLRGVPPMRGAVANVAAHLGHIRESSSGPVFNIKVEMRPEHLAQTNLALDLHTDGAYLNPVPGIQLLHVLKQSRTGGENLFVDGLTVARALRERDPEAFYTLTRVPVRFTHRTVRHDLTAERCLIERDARGDVQAVHYDVETMEPLCHSLTETRAFYRAYRQFAALLREPEFAYSVRLECGDVVMFDNQRLLHGRTAFDNTVNARHLQGCYLDKDALQSRLRVLERDTK